MIGKIHVVNGRTKTDDGKKITVRDDYYRGRHTTEGIDDSK